MTARRLKSYRSGDINEDLGIFLLKAFAVVAPVPRQEDVGIDAVATLLRDDGQLLIAEDSFCVQFKSSERRISYKEHEVAWLKALELPFLIGCVDRKRMQLSLFATHQVSKILIEGEYSEIVLHFSTKSTEIPGDHVRNVGLGRPLLRLDVEHMKDNTFAECAYQVLKGYLPAERDNLRFREIRAWQGIEWETNAWARAGKSWVVAAKTGDVDERRQIAKSIEFGLRNLYSDLLNGNDWSAFDKLVDFRAMLQKWSGVELPELNLMEQLAFVRRNGIPVPTINI